MYEIHTNVRRVNGVDVTTWCREIVDANILEIEVGTTGYQGGDTGHGGRTYFCLRDLASTDIEVEVLNNSLNEPTAGFKVTLGGDAELQTFIEALEFALAVLKDAVGVDK